MSRWEDTVPTGFAVGRFVSGPEKEWLEGHPLQLQSSVRDTGNTYQGKPSPRWLLNVALIETGELLCIGLAENGARNQIMAAGAKALDAGDTLDPICLELVQPGDGKAEYRTIRSATEEELDAALAVYGSLPKDAQGNVIAPEAPAPTTPAPATVPGERLRRAPKPA